MRSLGIRDVEVYCSSGMCHYREVYNADALPDDACLKEIEKRMRCGHLGADARPMWWSGSFGLKPAAKPWPGNKR